MKSDSFTSIVIPGLTRDPEGKTKFWIPAFAGMTKYE